VLKQKIIKKEVDILNDEQTEFGHIEKVKHCIEMVTTHASCFHNPLRVCLDVRIIAQN
jgi:hypothetical protein